MRKYLLLLTAALSLAVAPKSLSAGQWDKLTKLDVKETILIPGQELPPGKYVLKLMDSQSDRHIVMIYNEDQSKHIATVLAIPNTRLKPTGDTVLQYWETPAGVPPALRAWFYPGDNFGQEFAYPKEMADRLSRQNNAKVIYYDGPNTTDTTKETYKETQVFNHPVETAEAPKPAPIPESGDTAAVAVNTTPPAPEPTPVAEPQTAPQQPVVTAQNRTPEPAPAPMATEDQLPQTASNVPLLALAGLTLVGLAGFLGMRKVEN